MPALLPFMLNRQLMEIQTIYSETSAVPSGINGPFVAFHKKYFLKIGILWNKRYLAML